MRWVRKKCFIYFFIAPRQTRDYFHFLGENFQSMLAVSIAAGVKSEFIYGACGLNHLNHSSQGRCWRSTVPMEASKHFALTLTTLTTTVPLPPVLPSCFSLSGDFSF